MARKPAAARYTRNLDEEVLGKAYDSRLMGRLLVYMKPYRGTIAISLLLLLIGSLLQIAGPLLTRYAIDHYLTRPPDAAAFQGLTLVAFLYLGTIVFEMLFEFVQTFLMQRTGQQAMFDLRRDLMDKLQRLDLSYYDQNPVGRLLTRVTTDVDVLNELFSSGLVTIFGDLLMLSFVLIAMFQLSPGMTLMLLAVLPFVAGVMVIFRRTVQKSNRRIRTAVARINSFLQEYVSGMSVVQLFNREERARKDFDAINYDHMDAYKDAVIAYGWFYPVVEFLSMLSLALLLSWAGFGIQKGTITLGVLVAFLQYGLRFFRPIQDLSEKYNILQSAMSAAERIFKLLDTEPQITSAATPRDFPEGPLAIDFDHVWFAYKDEDWVLRDLSFRIEPGETIAVVGHTGAGKTTIISLLLRFYDIQRGSIRIGGVDLRDLRLEDLRRHFGVVLQDPYLFTGTVGGNIRLGTSSITDAGIEESARQVNLLDFIQTLPDGFASPVRERGSGFSTGQKQLISFARALAHNPRFLILDEATSSVDTETELRVREALDRMVTGRTSVIIAHRLSTIQRASRIFVMHKGQLRESGTHQQLLAMNGIYRKLYELQWAASPVQSKDPVAS